MECEAEIEHFGLIERCVFLLVSQPVEHSDPGMKV